MPRLGAFIATERPAYVNEEWGIVQAPMREVCFNAAIVNNDGLLATSIARRTQIPYEAACVRMEHAIDELRHHLDTEGEVTFGRIGMLRRSDDGRLIFTPALTARQQAAALGYDTVAIPSKVAKTRTGQEHQADTAYFTMRISKAAMRVAAGIALPLVAAVSILLWTVSLGPGARSGTSIDYASVVPMPTHQTAAPAPAAAVDDAPQGVLVVAVFDTEQQAQLFLNRHAASAHTLSISECGKSFRVTTAPQQRDALVELLHDTDFIVEYPGAWIWML